LLESPSSPPHWIRRASAGAKSPPRRSVLPIKLGHRLFCCDEQAKRIWTRSETRFLIPKIALFVRGGVKTLGKTSVDSLPSVSKRRDLWSPADRSANLKGLAVRGVLQRAHHERRPTRDDQDESNEFSKNRRTIGLKSQPSRTRG
jgi:hypothetical protein